MKIIRKYNVNYLHCDECGFICTERPFWLKEAYKEAIKDIDTGILARNISLSKMTVLISLLSGNITAKILDYAGGYGILTRLLRDIGLDSYWIDPYSQNIFARGYEAKQTKYGVITAFEFIEHTKFPYREIKNIFDKYSPKIFIFTTMLHNGNPPKKWWYFAPSGGQHISFFTKRSLETIARKLNYSLSTNNRNLHVISKKRFSSFVMWMIYIFPQVYGLFLPFLFRSKIGKVNYEN